MPGEACFKPPCRIFKLTLESVEVTATNHSDLQKEAVNHTIPLPQSPDILTGISTKISLLFRPPSLLVFIFSNLEGLGAHIHSDEVLPKNNRKNPEQTATGQGINESHCLGL